MQETDLHISNLRHSFQNLVGYKVKAAGLGVERDASLHPLHENRKRIGEEKRDYFGGGSRTSIHTGKWSLTGRADVSRSGRHTPLVSTVRGADGST
jgi:hypothetical protein